MVSDIGYYLSLRSCQAGPLQLSAIPSNNENFRRFTNDSLLLVFFLLEDLQKWNDCSVGLKIKSGVLRSNNWS